MRASIQVPWHRMKVNKVVCSLTMGMNIMIPVATVYFDAHYFESTYVISHKELGHWPCCKTLALLWTFVGLFLLNTYLLNSVFCSVLFVTNKCISLACDII